MLYIILKKQNKELLEEENIEILSDVIVCEDNVMKVFDDHLEAHEYALKNKIWGRVTELPLL